MPLNLDSCIGGVFTPGNIPASSGLPPVQPIVPSFGPPLVIAEAATAADALDYFMGELLYEPAHATDSYTSAGGRYVLKVIETAAAVDAPALAAEINVAQIEFSLATDDVSVRGPGVISASVEEAASAIDVANAALSGDPSWSSVKLLLGFEGADGSTGSPGMTDESSAAHGTATIFNQAQIDTAQFKFGASSLLLDGTADYVTFPFHTDYNLTNQPFTLECWIRPTTIAGGQHFICARWGATGSLLWAFYQQDATLGFGVTENGSTVLGVATGGALTANAWHAVCIEFDGTKYRLYLNGAMVGSSTTVRNIFSSATVGLSIGGSTNIGSFGFAGWIDELRFTKGVARYASDTGYTVVTSRFPRNEPVPATWDPASVTTVTLSGGNLVATNTGTTSADQGARVATVLGKTSGKYYFEVAFTTCPVNQGDNRTIGVGTVTSTYTGMGSGATTGIAVFRNTGAIYVNGSWDFSTTLSAPNSGDRIAVAVDLDNRKGWFRNVTQSGNWNGSGTANPATNVGGVTIPSGTMVPFVTFGGALQTASQVMTANFGASAFTGTVPSGFTSGWMT